MVNTKDITLKVLDATAWMDFMDNLMANKDTEVAIAAIEEEADALVMSAGVEVEDESGEDEESVVVTTAPAEHTADVDALIAKASDTLVQSTWGTAKACRAFEDSIGNRGQNATALAKGRGAAWAGVIGATSRLRSHGGRMGADHSLSGAVFGAEINGNAKHSFGMAIGETWGDINTISAYKVKQDSTHFGLYGQSHPIEAR